MKCWMIAGITFCCLGLLASGCNNSKEERKTMAAKTLSTAYEKEITRIIKSMTLDEKIALLHGNGKFTSAGIPESGFAEVQYTDGPLGVREEISRDSWNPAGWTTDSATFFPAGTALAATWNTNLGYKYGVAIGKETRARNKDILLAPAVNIIRTPLCGRNYEYFSEDPCLISRMTVPYILGVQEQDVAACVKHYAVNNQETNRGSVDIIASERAIREIYLPGFKAAVTEGGSYTIMGAYNKFRGSYLCENEYFLNTILREEWGFNGAVISDWGAVHSTVPSALAGLDIEMGTEAPFNDYYFSDQLLIAVKNGDIDEKAIDEKVRRLLRVLMNCKTGRPERKTGEINTPENQKLTYDVASEAAVLLKNSGNILPFNAAALKSLAVIGANATQTFANGGFGAGVKAKYEVTILQGLKNRLGNRVNVKFAQGYREQYLPGDDPARFYGLLPVTDPDPVLIKEAVKTAATCDAAIVVIGTTRRFDTEGDDRHDMFLPFGQDRLVNEITRANPKTVVVIIAGGPFDLRSIEENTGALLWTWFGGSEHGNALADIILGKVNPSGKLPYTIPKKLEDSPAHALNAWPGDPVKVEYLEDIMVGYRWFDTHGIQPMYPFGHGLSYTSFKYSDCRTDKPGYSAGDTIRLACTVRNSGDREGSEIIEVYVSAPRSVANRPAQELKGFAKVNLQPGEEKTVNIHVCVNDLSCFNENENGWKLYPGEYTLRIGASSRDIRREVRVQM
ncbi:MAG: glycoside hydrolase family 3 C-terminal domain-containing protein [Bacteroidota bacterium]